MIRNLNWYALNERRPYPFDDSATLLDDNGEILDHDYISDIFLRFPEAAGDIAFMSGFSCNSKIVTAVFLTDDLVPLAAISLAQPIVEGKHYALEPIYPGTGGWIVFGSAVVKGRTTTHRFSTAVQARLLAKTASKYKGLPVESLQAEGALEALTGVVRLIGGNDIEIVKEDDVTIDGVVRSAIVVRLKDKLGGAGQLDRNIYEEYLGPCDRRPETKTCGQPEPIEFINSVKPDCCGNITIELQGCGFYVPISQSCGIVMTCDFGLSEACVTKSRLPGLDGKLANEYDDHCVSFSSSLPVGDDEEEEDPSYTEPDLEESESAGVIVENLPYTETFDLSTASDFTTISGEFDFSGSGNKVWTTNTSKGVAVKNLAVWSEGIPEQSDWTSVFKLAETTVYFDTGFSGNLHNGGLVFNYRQLSGSDSVTYWTAELDWDGHFGSGAKVLRIGHFNGSAINTLLSTQITNLSLEETYKLVLTVYDAGNANAAWATVNVTNVSGPTVNTQVGPVYLPNYYPATGLFGLTSYRSPTSFGYFTVTNELP